MLYFWFGASGMTTIMCVIFARRGEWGFAVAACIISMLALGFASSAL